MHHHVSYRWLPTKLCSATLSIDCIEFIDWMQIKQLGPLVHLLDHDRAACNILLGFSNKQQIGIINRFRPEVKHSWELLRNASFWACNHLSTITGHWRTLKNISPIMVCTSQPAIQSCDTGQQIPSFDSY